MSALQFITGHVIFKLCYDQIYQMKTTINLKEFNWTSYMNSPKQAKWGNMAVGFLFLQEK